MDSGATAVDRRPNPTFAGISLAPVTVVELDYGLPGVAPLPLEEDGVATHETDEARPVRRVDPRP